MSSLADRSVLTLRRERPRTVHSNTDLAEASFRSSAPVRYHAETIRPASVDERRTVVGRILLACQEPAPSIRSASGDSGPMATKPPLFASSAKAAELPRSILLVFCRNCGVDKLHIAISISARSRLLGGRGYRRNTVNPTYFSAAVGRFSGKLRRLSTAALAAYNADWLSVQRGCPLPDTGHDRIPSVENPETAASCRVGVEDVVSPGRPRPPRLPTRSRRARAVRAGHG